DNTSTADAVITFGEYRKPFVLNHITTEMGRDTDFTYVPATHSSPAGDPSVEQWMHMTFPVVSTIETVDGYTGMYAKTSLTYSIGVVEDQAFEGFESVDRFIEGDVDQVFSYE